MNSPNTIPTATSGSRSKLLSGNLKSFLSKPALKHPQQALTVQLFNAEQKANGDATAPPRLVPGQQQQHSNQHIDDAAKE
ncbi:hypothetical protein PSV08DRAFT_376615 [Bipolaris maydis]|uniref:uncharacterized protein n=1 Tax=Cochliobolus heterostrophus TaxID=5016 RepID=UPI0024D6A4B0|nr:hypothetical protein J3E73DRAFT_406460 [Bipolaris maydis]KAJ6276041.1 hypothetical protein PSV08DRAFT_376615 [Bipolaris maydis]KAJ6287185.1 hypothetical protein J3E71DRAFT_366871 [Bipolaris maydis]